MEKKWSYDSSRSSLAESGRAPTQLQDVGRKSFSVSLIKLEGSNAFQLSYWKGWGDRERRQTSLCTLTLRPVRMRGEMESSERKGNDKMKSRWSLYYFRRLNSLPKKQETREKRSAFQQEKEANDRLRAWSSAGVRKQVKAGDWQAAWTKLQLYQWKKRKYGCQFFSAEAMDTWSQASKNMFLPSRPVMKTDSFRN